MHHIVEINNLIKEVNTQIKYVLLDDVRSSIMSAHGKQFEESKNQVKFGNCLGSNIEPNKKKLLESLNAISLNAI